MKAAVTTKHFELGPELNHYVLKKLDKLERYVPRDARKSVHAEVILHELSSHPASQFECEFIIHLPHETIVAKEATINMFAAVDIVEAKVKNKLRRYKTKLLGHDAWRSRLWRRLVNGSNT